MQLHNILFNLLLLVSKRAKGNHQVDWLDLPPCRYWVSNFDKRITSDTTICRGDVAFLKSLNNDPVQFETWDKAQFNEFQLLVTTCCIFDGKLTYETAEPIRALMTPWGWWIEGARGWELTRAGETKTGWKEGKSFPPFSVLQKTVLLLPPKKISLRVSRKRPYLESEGLQLTKYFGFGKLFEMRRGLVILLSFPLNHLWESCRRLCTNSAATFSPDRGQLFFLCSKNLIAGDSPLMCSIMGTNLWCCF